MHIQPILQKFDQTFIDEITENSLPRSRVKLIAVREESKIKQPPSPQALPDSQTPQGMQGYY